MIRTLGPGSAGTGLGHLAGAPGVGGGKCFLSGTAELLKLLQQRNLAPQQSVGTAVRAAGPTRKLGGGRDRSVIATCSAHPGQLHDLAERHFCPSFLPTVLHIQ